MLHPLQTPADVRAVVDAMRGWLLALNETPLRWTSLSRCWDQFRASFGNDPADDRADSNGWADNYGVPPLIRGSTALLSDAERDALLEVADLDRRNAAQSCPFVIPDANGAAHVDPHPG